MELLPTLINALVVAVVGGLGAYVTRTQTQDLRRELKEDIADVKEDVHDVKQEVRGVRTELRSGLTEVALAVGVQPRPQTG